MSQTKFHNVLIALAILTGLVATASLVQFIDRNSVVIAEPNGD